MTTQNLNFGADVTRLLEIVTHALYTNRDVFLRELISNAADACDRLRYDAIANPDLIKGHPGFAIRAITDTKTRTLTVTDTGIGMTKDELVENLGTIAKSGTRALVEQMKETGASGPSLIGQFGVGFYSSFMVANNVEVISRRAGSDETWVWTSNGQANFTLAPATSEQIAKLPAQSGTAIILHVKDEASDYLLDEKIKQVVKLYSNHISLPIYLGTDGTEAINSASALWMRPKSDITKEQYQEFYNGLSGMMGMDEPTLISHWKAEGKIEFTGLLYVPTMRPWDLYDPARKHSVRLYVRRVFITENCEGLIYPWLRFLRGVIDSEDLPLNMSREMLQKNPVIETIAKGVTGRVLSELSKLAETDADLFQKVWSSFGAVIKEGLYEAPERRDELFKVVRFKTTTSGDSWRSLADVVKDFKENQTAIYYALGEDEKQVLASPHLEGYAARGLEVLILTDPVDAFWVRTALGFEGKPFKSVTQGEADLDNVKPLEADKAEKPGAEMAGLVATLKDALKDDVADVRPSVRLATSPVCLVASDFGLDRMTEKLVARQEGKAALGKPVLELNAGHSLIKALAAKAAAGDTAAVTAAAPLLFGQARILDGEAPSDPAAFAASVASLLEKSLA